ncbi:MAG: rRNA maturation RNase YbeY [Planctomycetaceae bacterium]|nr:rRNA maturation RNase YbeY [Planctomycetaceae bacterium]
MTENDDATDPVAEHDSAPPLIEGIELAVADEQTHVQVDPDFLSRIAESLLTGEGVVHADISLAIVDDAEIHVINRQYLNHDYPTDVISFLLAEDTQDGIRRIDGELVISGETAARSALDYGCSPEDELALYFVHGLLHLCGYDDQTNADRETMRVQERSHLQKFGIEPHY